MSAVRSRSGVTRSAGEHAVERRFAVIATMCSVVMSTLLGLLVLTGQNVLAGTWDRQTVDSAGNVGQYTSIAIDAAGNPSIGYFDLANRNVKYARFDGSAWNVETVVSYYSVGQFLSMALDLNGLPHFSYYNGSGDSLAYTKWNGSAWVTTTVDSGGVVGWHTAIAVNASGFPRIAYYDATGNDLKFAKFDGNGWTTETVDSIGDVGSFASLALNSTDCPRISYYDASNGDLKVATWNGTNWGIATIDSDGDVGRYTSTALGGDDSIHISYYDATNVHLKYARLLDGSWSTTTVDSKNFVGIFSSVKVDGSGNVRIGYYDDSASTLRYARWNGTAWNIEVVDGPGAGSYSSMAIDSSGYVHLSYYDIANKHLKYARGVGNEAPATPSRPSGPTPVGVSQTYTYSTSTSDPENDLVSFIFSWGDGTTSQTGYVSSEVPLSISHSWGATGMYAVKARVIDVNGMQSWWSDALAVAVFAPPAAPWYLSASGGQGQVSLSWNVPPDDGGSTITGYEVQRGLASGHETYLAEAGTNAFIDDMVVNGETYYYTVRAKNAIGVSPDSNEVFAMPLGLPSAPTGLAAIAGDAQVMLNWTAPDDGGGTPVTNYVILRGTTAGGESLLTWTPVANIYLDTGLANGVTYYYEVRARNIVGEGAVSEEVNATPVTKPSPPGALAATSSSHQVRLDWTAPVFDGGTPITNYTILRGEWWNAESPLVEVGNVTSYTDNSLTNGRSCYYAITAKNAVGVSGWSNQVKATPWALPGPPTSLAAVAGDSQVMLTWWPPTDNGGFIVTNYTIWRGPASGLESLLAIVNDTPRYKDVGGLLNGVIYYYTVTATTAVGTGPNSTEISASPSTVPSEPRNLQAMAGDSLVSLSWEAPTSNGGSSITNYTLYWGLAPNGEIYRIDLGDVTGCIHTVLINGATYFYRVAARNTVGEGPRSSEASATPATNPGMPIMLRAEAGAGQVTLTWQPPADKGGLPIINYTIYRAASSEAETLLASIANEVSFLDSGLTNGLTYYYKVAAVNEVGEGPLSGEVNATPSTKPSQPRNLIATAGNREVTLSWAAPASDGGFEIAGYEIARGVSAGGESPIAQVGNVTVYVDTGLTNGRTYYYTVSAITSVGKGPESNENSATPCSVPGRPEWIEVEAGYGQVKLKWTAPTDDGGFPITGYSLSRGITSGGEVLLKQLGSVSEYLDTGLDNGITYFYTVAAVNSVGTGAISHEVSATPRDMPPGCAIWSPTWGMTVSKTINVTGSASDDSGVVERVQIRIDDGEWMNATGTAFWTYEWDTKDTENGQHVIRARSYDGHNFSAEIQVSVEVSNAVALPSEEGSVLAQPWFWAMSVLIIFGVLALVVMMARRRKRKVKKEDESLTDLLDTE